MLVEDKKTLMSRIDDALETIRPHLAVDGGDVEVMDVRDDMTVVIKWLGACVNCSMSTMTLKAGIEQAIRNKIPSVKAVEAINEAE